MTKRETMASRLRDRYKQEITPALMRDLGKGNVNAVPRLEKIVLNMGLGEATQNPKLLDSAVEELASISGRRGLSMSITTPKSLACASRGKSDSAWKSAKPT